MIATLTGTVAEKLVDSLVIEVQGIGYGVYVVAEDHGAVATGQQIKLYIYEHIRENSHDLFGFTKPATKQLFEQLLSVTGVGPKMAAALLSVGTAEAVRTAIAGGDTKYLQAASGVGRRVAERVIVDLKDKVGLASADSATDFLQGPSLQDEAVQALMTLGYSPQDAANSLKNVDKKLPTEERVKQALKGSPL